MVDGIPEPESVTTWNFDGSYPVPMLNFVQAKISQGQDTGSGVISVC